jgi:hypothetical protein
MLFLYIFYLVVSAISRRVQQQVHIKFCANIGKVRLRSWQWLDESLGKKAWTVHGTFKLIETEKRRDRWRAKSRVCSSCSLTSRGFFTNNSSRHAELSIPHTIVTFYGDCVKMCEDFALNFDDKRTGCCITVMHRFTLPFSLGNLDQKQHNCRPPPILLCCFFDWR